MKTKLSTAGWVLATALGMAVVAGSASATPTPIDPTKVQALAIQIEDAISQLGADATVGQDVTAIQSAIATSGASPAEVIAALDVVQTAPGLSRRDHVAVASVNRTIEVALEGAGPQAGPGGGPGGGSPIGSPPAYVSGGGSNYIAP
jgi:hypothetical protein